MGWIVGLLVVIALLLLVLVVIGIVLEHRLIQMHTALANTLHYLAELVQEAKNRR